MKSRFMSLSVVLGGILACGVGVTPVAGANLNINTTQCQPMNPANKDFVIHDAHGVRTAPGDRWVVVTCSLMRSPLDLTRSYGFYIDGDNYDGASTACWISSYDYTGAYLGGASFSTSAPSYDWPLYPPPAALSQWAYIALRCTLPPNGTGVLRGMTSMQ